MARIRWYHFFFLLAVFDVVVIFVSLESHRRTLASVGKLIGTAGRLDEQANWLQRAQQAILELNDPGNDVFDTNNVAHERRRFEHAKNKVTVTMADADKTGLDVTRVKADVARMIAAEEQVFAAFGEIQNVGDDSQRREQLRASAGSAMARMDDEQRAAIRSIGMLMMLNTGERKTLLDLHDRDAGERSNRERYFIAAAVLILVGMLFFGRRLQLADRALEAERKRLQEERRERLAAIGELCSSVAHGIRNPLAAMRSSAQLTLEMGKIDEESRERVNDILSEGQKLGDRVTRLLSFARVRTDGLEELDLGEVVSSSINELTPELRRRDIQVKSSVPAETIPVVGDRHQLQQAAIELLSNAMEQSRAGDAIRVDCRAANGDGMAVFSVQDQGPGVPPEVRSRIFELFFTTKPTGSGIGLATVRRIARLHGGDVRLDETPSGARFAVSIPTTRNGANVNGSDIESPEEHKRRP